MAHRDPPLSVLEMQALFQAQIAHWNHFMRPETAPEN
jgi:hypothetical protein